MNGLQVSRLLVVALLLATVAACTDEPAVDASRLIPIDDMTEWPAELGFGNKHELEVTAGGLLITDPIYLADVYNVNDDPVAAYVRTEGVFASDFGGDTSCPVWWKKPHLVMPVGMEAGDGSGDGALATPPGASIVADEVGCDSGSFVFLALGPDLPAAVREAVDLVVAERNGAVIDLPRGRYTFAYEQVGSADARYPAWYRNIVATLE